eukprot:5532000-Prymnesium_polylepis.2
MHFCCTTPPQSPQTYRDTDRPRSGVRVRDAVRAHPVSDAAQVAGAEAGGTGGVRAQVLAQFADED